MTVNGPMTVQLGNLVVSNLPQDTPVRWKLTDLAGWYSSTVRTGLTERPQGMGAFRPARSQRGSKVLQLQGIYQASSWAQAEQECADEIAAVSPEGTDVELRVTTDAGTRIMVVRVEGTIDVQPYRATQARFNVPLVAADPRKLSAAVRSVSTGLEGGGAVPGAGLVFPLFGSAPLTRLENVLLNPEGQATNGSTWTPGGTRPRPANFVASAGAVAYQSEDLLFLGRPTIAVEFGAGEAPALMTSPQQTTGVDVLTTPAP